MRAADGSLILDDAETHRRTVEATLKMVDDGSLMSGGWDAMLKHGHPIRADLPEHQLALLRFAYLAGAQHLWAAARVVTSGDQMQRIDDEMSAVREELLTYVRFGAD